LVGAGTIGAGTDGTIGAGPVIGAGEAIMATTSEEIMRSQTTGQDAAITIP
jgi:hypothetical protein